MKHPVVTSKWLYDHLDDQNLVILDASMTANAAGLTAELQDQKIKGARFFDLKKDFSDASNSYPNAFPSSEQFEKACRALGINNQSQLIVYDNLGIYTSPRVWWMFRAMGHENIQVLDGGLPGWIAEGYTTVLSYEKIKKLGDFSAKLNSSALKDLNFIKANALEPRQQLIDARSSGRFTGKLPEPRAGLPSGHIPNSINIPYTEVLKGGFFKTPDQLRTIFEQIDDENPVIFSCGSGITACIVLLAFTLIKNNETAIYDGSWTEWATEHQGKN